MPDFEKLGAFYLGRLHDLDRGETEPGLLLYDSKDLTTHAVCVGMTGSGKTGLCLALLEEAAIDGIPAIAIDPKGDLGNLLLAFPDLEADDFRPWIEEREATRQGVTPDQFAEQTAKKWRDGLAEWEQGSERIERYRSSVDFAIYTPASTAGLPLTILKSFDAPPAGILADANALRERIATSVAGLLALLGIDADPIRSREHILLSNVFDRAWREQRSLDIPTLIGEIQKPPFDKIGIMDLETIFPASDRFELAMALNNLLASPSFASWMEGEPLDIKRLLYTPQGKPRLSIISIAHLSETERMFFVTILLNEILAWTRSQSGTSSLRALLYMDEVFGYFPPTANPPSKAPMLTLLKQARAYGLGIVLATQNPVDLDYKGLSNAGTWFLGRLQTERDKTRVLEGLEGAAAQTGANFDRGAMESTLAALGNRVFLMNNVHDDAPVVFHTRWALSYLRGPMTRQQIETVMEERKSMSSQTQPGGAAGRKVHVEALPPRPSAAVTTLQQSDLPSSGSNLDASQRPIVPIEADECFVRIRTATSNDSRLVYRPALLGTAQLHFVRVTYKVDQWQKIRLLGSQFTDDAHDVWDKADVLDDDLTFDKSPDSRCQFAPLPAELGKARNYKSWTRDLKEHLYREMTVNVWKCAQLKTYSEPNEAEDDFRIRLSQLAKERRDLNVEKLRARYAKRFTTLRDRIRRAEERVDREKSQYRSKQLQSAISLGTSVLGALFGRKLASRTNVSRAGTTLRSAERAVRERDDMARAADSLDALEQKLAELESKFEEETRKVQESLRADDMELEKLEVRPRKTEIDIEKCALAWTPWQVDSQGIAEPAW